jgi:hypothetical protein
MKVLRSVEESNSLSGNVQPCILSAFCIVIVKAKPVVVEFTPKATIEYIGPVLNYFCSFDSGSAFGSDHCILLIRTRVFELWIFFTAAYAIALRSKIHEIRTCALGDW